MTKRLQHNYFIEPSSYDNFVREKDLPKMNNYRIAYGSTLQELVQRSNQKAPKVQRTMSSRVKRSSEKLIIFIALGEQKL